MDKIVEPQKVVTFIYSILDQDGKTLEQSDLPLSYLHGVDGKMYERVEAALTGKKIDDEVRVALPPEDGFGPHDAELIYNDAIENVPPEFRRLGAEAEFEDEQGEKITMFVTKIENGRITLDGNHPFAGMTVTFVIKILNIRDAAVEELDRGEVAEMEDAPNLH